MDNFTVLWIASAAFLIAGTIKGLAGLGLPTAAIAGMTLVLEPRIAIALVLFPMLGLNAWQWIRAGKLLETTRKYIPFAIVLVLGVTVVTFASKDIPDRALMAALGVVILIFVSVSWGGFLPKLKPKHDLIAQIGFASFAGFIGGLTAAWAAPLGMYLTMKQVDKDEFIRASGYLITVGSIPLVVAYAQLGFLTGPLAIYSIGMLIPAMIGFSMGEFFRNKLSPEYFRRAILIVFFLLAINLLRRAIWYV